MTTVFIGGSRHVSRLPELARERLHKVVANGHDVVVGDATGADKAVQKFLMDASYGKVTVFCSGDKPRNNVGAWQLHTVAAPKNAKGFAFFAAKDREMARAADFGLMIWDGKSPGTVLNVLRLIRAGKKAVLLDLPGERTLSFKAAEDWEAFLAQCSNELRNDLRERATPEEWQPAAAQASLPVEGRSEIEDQHLVAEMNAALDFGDPAAVLEILGKIAKARGMSQVAKDAGVARESLYRSLGSDGNPEFATVMKVLLAVGLQLKASQARGRRA